MSRFPTALLVVVCISWAGSAAPGHAEGTGAPAAVPDRATNFRLTDHEGRSHELYRHRDAKAIVLFYGGNGCPIVQQSVPRLKEIQAEFARQGVLFAMVNASPYDELEEIRQEVLDYEISMPVLLDTDQLLTQTLGVIRTATTIVIVPGQRWRIAYYGPMDDRFDYGFSKPEPKTEYLKDALNAVLASEDAPVSYAEAKGCQLDLLAPEATPEYAADIAPVIARKCTPCHNEDGIGPFALTSHEDVRKWRRMIKEVVLTKRMPPWHADPHYGAFANDNALTSKEAQALFAWIDADTPRGEGDDPLLAAAPDMAIGWTLGEPDLVVALPEEQTIPAEGVFEYRYLQVPIDLEEGVWLRGVDVKPGNRRVLHHCLVFVRYPRHMRNLQPEYESGVGGYFAGYVPGMAPTVFPDGTGKYLPAGSQIIFQMHYNATGKDETDLTKLGLYFAEEEPEYEYVTRAAYNKSFEIPPRVNEYVAQGQLRLDEDVLLFSMNPHMHYRGSWFKYEAKYPDGTSETLLSVPFYDFNWQTSYELATPKRIPAGTTITATGAWDNSPGNPANPDAEARVTFGEQTFDEMLIGYMAYAPLEPARVAKYTEATAPDGTARGDTPRNQRAH